MLSIKKKKKQASFNLIFSFFCHLKVMTIFAVTSALSFILQKHYYDMDYTSNRVLHGLYVNNFHGLSNSSCTMCKSESLIISFLLCENVDSLTHMWGVVFHIKDHIVSHQFDEFMLLSFLDFLSFRCVSFTCICSWMILDCSHLITVHFGYGFVSFVCHWKKKCKKWLGIAVCFWRCSVVETIEKKVLTSLLSQKWNWIIKVVILEDTLTSAAEIQFLTGRNSLAVLHTFAVQLNSFKKEKKKSLWILFFFFLDYFSASSIL